MENKSVENTTGAKRQMRFTSNELDLLHRLFHENDVLLKAIRKAFLQFEISDSEKDLLKKTFLSKDAFDVLEKVFNPKLDGDAPILQLVDMWLNVEIKDKDTGTALPFIIARKMMCEYIDEFFETLKINDWGGGSEVFADYTKIDFESEDPADIHAKILARNNLLAHCEAQLNQIIILAKMGKPVDEAKIKENAKKDSTQ